MLRNIRKVLASEGLIKIRASKDDEGKKCPVCGEKGESSDDYAGWGLKHMCGTCNAHLSDLENDGKNVEKILKKDKVYERAKEQGALEGGTDEKKEDKGGKSFEESVKGKKFRNPETGNDVAFGSLPADEQKKLRKEFDSKK